MSQDDQLHQYGYDHYLKAPKRSRVKPQSYRSGKTSILRRFQSPTVATVILMAAAVLFVTVVFSTYPDSKSKVEIPIVKADLSPVKEAPRDVGGMSIPNKKSTILARANKPSIQDEQNRIENLLARKKEEAPMSREDAIKSTQAAGLVIPESSDLVSVIEDNQIMPSGVEDDIASIEGDEAAPGKADMIVADVKPLVEDQPKQPKASEILQKIGSSKADKEGVATDEFSQKVASAAIRSKPRYAKPVTQAKADKTPETIDYVRSVLNKDENPSVQNIEPAAGAATSAKQLQSGSYFVQLASITDPARAAGEWKKMQDKYGVLSVSKFRIQEASLSNGKFYRIQAGPMSKSDANRICNALKQAKKPGGCLVVQ
ncbi:MAG: SPOR domain-containing protein [Alcanivorax sp.]